MSNTEPRKQQPSTWDDYEQGGRSQSIDSTAESHVQWDDLERQRSNSSHRVGLRPNRTDNELRHRQSSISMRLDAFRQAGGVNSFDNFARSWQRAAGFFEVTPVRRSFLVQGANEEDPEEGAQDIAETPHAHRSLLRQALDHRRSSDEALDDSADIDEAHETDVGDDNVHQRLLERKRSRAESIIHIDPSLASAFGGSYGTTYGSLVPPAQASSMRHAGRLYKEQQMKGISGPDGEREPLLVKQVEEDGVKFNVIVGQSTVPQTIFNSVNVLIGVGLLSIPLAFNYAGWIIGLAMFVFAVVTTQYTAKLLAKCLDVDSSLITFADLAYVSFGQSARIATSVIFSLELIGANVALIILFGDSLDALIDGWGTTAWKLVCGVILVPLAFLPLRLLSFTSILGILSCLGIVIAVLADGFIKPHQPGSLRQPAQTHLLPERWSYVPLSFGLLMSPWGGHSVFPNIYRDMRHPYRYHEALRVTYSFTFLLDLAMGIAGLLMFGDLIRDEVTANILLTRGYPAWLSVCIVVFIAIIPLTKVPLNARPIISTVEILLGLDVRALAVDSTALVGMSGFSRGLLKVTLRVVVQIIFVGIAISFPSFDRIMTLLGSVCCFSICIILPLAFHLKLFGKELGSFEYWMNWSLMALSIVMALVSTVFACIPKQALTW